MRVHVHELKLKYLFCFRIISVKDSRHTVIQCNLVLHWITLRYYVLTILTPYYSRTTYTVEAFPHFSSLILQTCAPHRCSYKSLSSNKSEFHFQYFEWQNSNVLQRWPSSPFSLMHYRNNPVFHLSKATCDSQTKNICLNKERNPKRSSIQT